MDEITFKLAMGASGSGSPTGQAAFLSYSDNTFTVPPNVFFIHAVVIDPGEDGADGRGAPSGGGSTGRGGRGGNLRWKNNIPVVPGEVLRVMVGLNYRNGQGYNDGYAAFIERNGVKLLSGTTALGGDVGGGNGGAGGRVTANNPEQGAGGGAGGYAGNGGDGEQPADSTVTGSVRVPPGDGSGGAGAGGLFLQSPSTGLGPGGSVGVHGQGVDGIAPAKSGSPSPAGTYHSNTPRGPGHGGRGGNYNDFGGAGGQGAVRIIWGDNRAFPSLRTHDL